MSTVDTATDEGEALPERYASDALEWPAVRELLVRHALSAIGERAVRALRPRPEEEARRALRRTRELFESSPDDLPPLARLLDPAQALEEARRYSRSLEGERLHGIGRLLRVSELVGHWLAGRRGHLELTAELWDGLPDLSPLRLELERALDEKGNLQDDASVLLKRLSDKVAKLDREIDKRMRALASTPAWRVSLAEGHIGRVPHRRRPPRQAVRVSLAAGQFGRGHHRGGRRVLAVRAKHAGRVPGIVHDRSKTGETIFVEPREVVPLANELSGAEADRRREAARILMELTRTVLKSLEPILFVRERLAELELAVVAARYARAVGGAPPRFISNVSNETTVSFHLVVSNVRNIPNVGIFPKFPNTQNFLKGKDSSGA